MRVIITSGLLLLLACAQPRAYAPRPLLPHETLVPILVRADLTQSGGGALKGVILHVYDSGPSCPSSPEPTEDSYQGFLPVALDRGGASFAAAADHRLLLRFYFDMSTASLVGHCDVEGWLFPEAGHEYEVRFWLEGPRCGIVAEASDDPGKRPVPLHNRCFSQEMAEANHADSVRFLAENASRPGVKVLSSGLQYRVLREGSGATPGPQSVVRAHYRGRLPDGTELQDNSYQKGAAQTFPIDRVIQGWREGLPLMREGAVYEFFIPPELAYGELGAFPGMPPNVVIIHEVELIKVDD